MDGQNEIKVLNEASVRRIVAEQAITDLSSIVKELVDNALDAESKTIKIRLFGQGIDVIEVSDDGCGVSIHSRAHLATRYATSKINSFEDLYTGTGLSLGFRGEALFSLACLSEKLIVATRTDSDQMAQKLGFNADGSLDENSVSSVHRKIGTTVAVVKPFSKLPARRADLTRRIKAERSKLFRLMESYAIFNVGIAINLIDIVSGREGVALATSSTSTKLEETVSAVMGHKFLSSLAPIDLKMKGILNMDNNDGYGWGIKGLISKNPQAISPCPRTINCYSINGRVVELPKITSLLRKIWTGFGGKKKPSCVFSFTLPNDRFDINLSPDKQQVLLSDEQEICQLLQEYVTRFYSNKVNGVFQAQPLQVLTEQEDENVGERSMHKQRFAFVHDLSKARMQHDLSGRESFDGIEKEAECPNNADTQQSVELEEGTEPISKKSRVATREMIGATTTSSLLHRESRVKKIYEFGKSGPSFRSQERISDLERRKWTEIQSKFHSNSDDIQNTLLRPEPERNTPDDLPHEKFTIKSLPSFSDDQRQGRDQRSATKIYMEQEVKNDDDRYDDEDSDREEEGADDDEEEDRHATRRRRLVNFENVRHQSLGQKSSHSQSQYEKSTSQEERVQKTRIVARQQNDDCRGEAGVEKVEALQESTDLSDDLESVEGDHHEIGDGDKTSTETGRGSTDKEDPSQEEDEETNHVVADQHPGPTDESFERITSEVSMKIRDVESAPSLVWKSFGSAEQISCNTRYERLQMYQRKKDQVLVHNSAKKDFPIEKGAEDITNSVGTQKSSDGNVVSLSKNEFRGGMQVLGQFNLGFILCRCEKNNLWILDQHACDEKFNFEKLCRETVLHEQKLLRPMPLELSPMEEACILDHLNVFEANGFHFEFRPDAPIRKRLFLTALPHSGAQDGRKAVQFGKDDVIALCAMLSEGSSYDAGDGGTGTDGSGKFGNNAVRRYASTANSQVDSSSRLVLRLPKAIAMFASRACRTSIMIGTALSQKEMEAIVKRLADVEHPWNCPHGRPTMRHVGDVLPVMLNDERKAAEHLTGVTSAVAPMTQD